MNAISHRAARTDYARHAHAQYGRCLFGSKLLKIEVCLCEFIEGAEGWMICFVNLTLNACAYVSSENTASVRKQWLIKTNGLCSKTFISY